MGQDLNTLMPTQAHAGDHGIHEPVNAWPDATADVVVSLHQVGEWLVMTGHDVATPEVGWLRKRDAAGAWTEWQELSIEPPPAPEAEVEEAPNDGQLYGRQNGAWVVIPPSAPAADEASTQASRR